MMIRSFRILCLSLATLAATPSSAGAETPSLAQAEALRTTGRLRDAAEAFEAVRRSGEPRQQAVATFGLGNLQLQRHHHEEAERTLHSARAQAEGLKLTPLTAAIDNSLGALYAAQRRLPEADQAYASARRGALAAGDPLLACEVLVNQARNRADPALARKGLVQALGEARALPKDVDGEAHASQATLYLSIAAALCPPEAACPSAAQSEAFAALEEARRIGAARNDPRLRSQALGQMGRLYEGQGRRAEALGWTREAIAALEGQPGGHDLLLQWEWQRGRLLRAQDAEAAIQAYRRAVAHIEAIRADIPVVYADGRSSFRDTLEPIYLGLADLLLRRAEADPARVEPLLREARDGVERVKVAELNDYFHDSCITPVGGDTALEQIDSRTAVLYPITLPDRLVLLLSSARGIRQFVTPVERETLGRTVAGLRRNLQSPEHNRFLDEARRLDDWVIRPLQGQLAQWGVDTLVVVPDGALRTIPFAALHDGERFLIERYAVVTSPGLMLTDPKGVDWGQRQILLAGLSEGVQGFAPLPNVPGELAAIRAAGKGDSILNQEYVLTGLQSRLQATPYTALHLATHGRFTGEPSRNFLLTYDDRLTMDRLESLIGLGQGRERPLELLTLSACQTALGDDRAALGLAGLAVKAGARSAIATLWFVDDEATAQTMAGFYRELMGGTGVTKARALQTTQVAMIAQERYWHPAYWAPFLLIGNWL